MARSPPAETKPGLGEQPERVVDRGRLDDAVQVELHAAAEHEHAPVELDVPRRRGVREWCLRRLQAREVAVVPRCLERRPKRRIDEAVRLLARPQRGLDHPREQRRHEAAAAAGVDGVQLALRAKATEDRVALGEQRPHRCELLGGRPLDEDVTPHRGEAVHVCAVTTEGSAWAGARIPDSSWFRRTVSTKRCGGESALIAFL